MKSLRLISIALLFSFLSIQSLAQQVKTNEEIINDIIVEGELIVRFDEKADPYIIEEQTTPLYEVKVDQLLSKPSDIWLVKYNHHEIDYKTVLKELTAIEGVYQAQINTVVELRAAPNDPLYGNQWQHQNIESELAWDITTGGTSAHGDDIVVCIIESCDVMGHPDLQDNHWVNTNEIPNNGVDDDGNGYIDDYNGWNVASNDDNIGNANHGTSVAGMIGATGDNNLGVVGANWDVKMMVVAGYANPFTQANIVQAYTYPLEHRLLWNSTNGADGAFVVATNASWGIDFGDPNDYPIWCDFYNDLGQAGILNCGATSNSNYDVDALGDVPTACASDYLIGVTATDVNDVKTFAAFGQNTINVAAPGDGIYTTQNGGSGYGNTQGTSFASPLTAGVLALMYSIPCTDFMDFVKADPQAAAEEVRDALYNGVDQTTQLQTMTTTGGRINANTSVNLLNDQYCSSCGTPSNVQITNISDTEIEISFDAVADADEYIVKIREVGAATWNTFNTTNTNYTFTNLEPCTEYEIVVQADCAGDLSSDSAVTVDFTTGCGDPNAIISILSNSVCEGDCINFNDASIGVNISAWNWQFNGGNPSSSTSQIPDPVCFDNVGTYDITLTVTDDNGTGDTTITVNVVDCSSGPDASFSVSNNSPCDTVCIDFQDNSVGQNISAWEWDFGNGASPNSSNIANPIDICFDIPGTYTVTLTVTDDNGTATHEEVITVNDCSGIGNPPIADFTYEGDACEGACIDFTDLSTNNPTSWQWTFDGGNPSTSTEQNPSNICFENPGVSNVTLSATNSDGTSTFTLPITINPSPNVDASGDTLIDLGGSAELNVSSNTTGDIQWSPSNDLDCSDCPEVIATPYITTNYTVTVTDINGCSGSDIVIVMVDSDEDIIGVPSAFSPNNDGFNDLVRVLGVGIEEMSFKIYNRYGQLVFETTEQSEGWDGVFNGQKLNQGVFAYTLEYTLTNGVNGKKEGSITLIK
jgi:gliding motility-associated-like protein